MRKYGWRYIKGKPRRNIVRREIREVQGRSRREGRRKEKVSAKKQGEIGKTLVDIRRVN